MICNKHNDALVYKYQYFCVKFIEKKSYGVNEIHLVKMEQKCHASHYGMAEMWLHTEGHLT